MGLFESAESCIQGKVEVLREAEERAYTPALRARARHDAEGPSTCQKPASLSGGGAHHGGKRHLLVK